METGNQQLVEIDGGVQVSEEAEQTLLNAPVEEAAAALVAIEENDKKDSSSNSDTSGEQREPAGRLEPAAEDTKETAEASEKRADEATAGVEAEGAESARPIVAPELTTAGAAAEQAIEPPIADAPAAELPANLSEEEDEEDESSAEDGGSDLDEAGRSAAGTNSDAGDGEDKSDASEEEGEEVEALAEDGNGRVSQTSEATREQRLKRRLTSFDKRQEKFSQMKATVKTFDVNMEVVIGKWKRLREDYIKLRANSVMASGDDGSLMITRRMTELGNMCSRTTNAAYYIATLPEAVQIVIRKMTALTRYEFTEFRRRGWNPYDWFLYAARMARVLAQACLVRRRLTIEALANGRAMAHKDLVASSMSKNLRDCMTYCPEYRTKDMRQKILWFLRTNKVYTHLFSSEMEEECTKNVFYEKYQDGRMLALCDRKADKFYYVISGKIEKRRTYELRAGDYDRVFSVITKGRTSDSEQMEQQKPMKFNLVASGLTEVLTLEREDFMQLLKGTGGLPLKFLQGIGIFQEFPCERFLTSPEAILTRYFPKDRVILEDITDTQWIHVVKSGTARVIRKQMVFHYASNKYTHKRSIGYSKPPSHSQAMQGLTERQRQYRTQTKPDHLPALNPGQNPLSYTIGIPRQKQREPEQSEEADNLEKPVTVPVTLPMLTPTMPTSSTAAMAATGEDGANGGAAEAKARRNRKLNMIARELQIPLRSAGSTRGGAGGPSSRLGKDAASMAKVLLGPDGIPVNRAQREAYVVLDTLRSGDFLGFRNITALIEGERIARDKENVLTLLSDGAEIILINKRFFVQNAANNTMLKAEALRREFLSKEEASLSIDAKEDWQMFKAAFIQRMASQTKDARKERQTNQV